MEWAILRGKHNIFERNLKLKDHVCLVPAVLRILGPKCMLIDTGSDGNEKQLPHLKKNCHSDD
jgi:hypothetical protein